MWACQHYLECNLKCEPVDHWYIYYLKWMAILLGSTQWNGKYGSVIIIMNDTRATYGLPLGYGY